MRRILTLVVLVSAVAAASGECRANALDLYQQAAAGETASSIGTAVSVQTATAPVSGSGSTASSADGFALPPQCSLVPADSATQALLGQPAGQPPGRWYYLSCGGLSHAPLLPSFIPNGAAGPAANAVSPVALAQTALASAAIPAPAIGTSPDTRHLLVNYPTRLYLTSGWGRVSATASAGAVTATVAATPYKVVWSMGDGSSVTCDNPGTPYDPNKSWASQNPPPCGYTYSESSANQPDEAYRLTATVYYHVTWAAGALGGGALGDLTRSSTVPAYVGEVQTLEN